MRIPGPPRVSHRRTLRPSGKYITLISRAQAGDESPILSITHFKESDNRISSALPAGLQGTPRERLPWIGPPSRITTTRRNPKRGDGFTSPRRPVAPPPAPDVGRRERCPSLTLPWWPRQSGGECLTSVVSRAERRHGMLVGRDRRLLDGALVPAQLVGRRRTGARTGLHRRGSEHRGRRPAGRLRPSRAPVTENRSRPKSRPAIHPPISIPPWAMETWPSGQGRGSHRVRLSPPAGLAVVTQGERQAKTPCYLPNSYHRIARFGLSHHYST